MPKNGPPIFTVVVPVYNKGPHISRCLESIQKQTFPDFEVLMVDDASSDDSVEQIRNCDDPRIRLVHRDTPGPGGYAARNLGTKLAQTDWIAFLDADDEWLPDHLECMARLTAQFPDADVLGAGRVNTIGDRDVSTEAYYEKKTGNGNHFLTLDGYLHAYINGLRPLCTSVACLRKNVLLEAGGFPDKRSKRGGDIDTWLRCIAHAGGMAWSAHIGVRYHKDSVNMVTQTSLNTAEAEYHSVRELLKSHSGKTARLLKLFANNRTMKAYKEHRKFRGQRPFRFLARLYFSAIPYAFFRNRI